MYNFTILRTCKQLNKQLFDLKCVLSSFPTHMFHQVHSIATQVSIDYIKKKVQVEIMIPVSTIQYGKNRFLRLIYQSGFEGSFAVMDP